jgi:signal transduction histidine kinase
MSSSDSGASWSTPAGRAVRTGSSDAITAMRVLLVEDSVVFAEAIKLLLEDASNVDVKLTHVEKLSDIPSGLDPGPDVVLLDLALPDAQGLDTIRGVQARLPGAPIVVLTADSNENLAIDVVRNGAQDFLVKGRFDIDTLIRTMRYAIERVRSEQLKRQLLQADRLAAIGHLAAGVAHEISNPATFVQSSAGLLRAQLDRIETALREIGNDAHWPRGKNPAAALALDQAGLALDEARQLSEQNASGVDRICAVVRDLRGYSRLESGNTILVDANEVVDEVCKLASNVVRHKARLVKDLAPVPRVALPRGRLDQILTNLLVNAAQAIADSPPQNNQVTISTRVDRDSVIVAVEDTGTGMTPEQVKRAFEPFFTTKPQGVGVGLGLSICREIARAHRGDVCCRSEQGHGSRFEVRLPVATELEIRRASTPPPPLTMTAERPRVLMVDDEPNIREMYSRLLKDDFDVTTAGNGAEAIEAIGAHGPFDVIVSDLMMPDMDASELLETLATTAPHVIGRFILYTGGPVSERARRLVDSGDVPVLYKPLPLEELAQAIRRKMSGG